MNSKLKGNIFEKQCVQILKANIFPDCHLSRHFGSAYLDNLGVDLTGTGNFYVQCKAVERSLPYHEILKKMPSGQQTNIVLHQRNGSGIIVAMDLQDFIKLIKNGSGAPVTANRNMKTL